MRNVLVAYTTFDGHSAKVAEHIASAIQSRNCAIELCDLARCSPKRSLEEYDGAIIGGPLHRGKHHRQLYRFVSENVLALNALQSAFFSVSLSAAGNSEQKRDATRCLSEFLDETGWEPTSRSIVAGAILYRKYGFFKRWMMKMIVKRGGTGDTDTSRNYVYTNWEALERFTREFVGSLESCVPEQIKTMVT